MDCKVFRRTGETHLLQNKPSGDITYREDTDRFLFFGVADAQTGAAHGEVGAQAALLAAAAYFEKNSDQISALLSADEKKAAALKMKMRSDLSCEITDLLENLSFLLARTEDETSGADPFVGLILNHLPVGNGETKCLKSGSSGRIICAIKALSHLIEKAEDAEPDIDSFASTLMFCAIDKIANAVIFINIGDGMVCARKELATGTTVETILDPDRNSVFPWATYLTNCTFLGEHIRITVRTLDDYSSFALLTDGTEAYGASLLTSSKEHISRRAWELLLPEHPSDDATVFLFEK